MDPVFLWCDETYWQPSETGIQRVVRRLGRALAGCGVEVVPVGWDRRTCHVKPLGSPARRLDQVLEGLATGMGSAPWLLVPETSIDLAAVDLDPIQIGGAYGLRTAALLHDVIPLKRGDDYDDEFLARFRRYFGMFAKADLVLTTTNYVTDDLRAQLSRVGSSFPLIATLPLPSQFADHERVMSTKAPRAPGAPLRLLTVSTWEPRKNFPCLLRAIRAAGERSPSPIELTMVGQRGRFSDHDAEIDRLLQDLPRVTWRGAVSDAELIALYASSHASIYPSVEEGFGLPIGESLWLATPCVCHLGSSMAETAPGGGTWMVDMTSEIAITDALLELANDPAIGARLSAEIPSRRLTSWHDYAIAVRTCLDGVPSSKGSGGNLPFSMA